MKRQNLEKFLSMDRTNRQRNMPFYHFYDHGINWSPTFIFELNKVLKFLNFID
jgi:hypothetical protein